jgi:hypothetical protein
MMEWKNTPDLFNDYVHLEECPWAMKQILLQNKWFFDDDYFYWLPLPRKGTKHLDLVKRRPLYWYPQKNTPAEKVKRYIPGKQIELIIRKQEMKSP